MGSLRKNLKAERYTVANIRLLRWLEPLVKYKRYFGNPSK